MCFITQKSARAKIAKTDIECWKELESEGQPFFHDELPPYQQGFINPKVKIKKEFSVYFGTHVIEEGYHSWRSLEIAESERFFFCSSLHKFIIPKGTRYFENKTEYVSETIMLIEQL